MLAIVAIVAVVTAIAIPVIGELFRTRKIRLAEAEAEARRADREARHVAWCKSMNLPVTPLP